MSLSIDCPECGEPLEVDDEYRSWKVRCPRCRHEFRPADTGRAADWAEDDSPPPRRSRRRRDDWDPEAAARDVASPALFLELIGWGSCVLILIASALLIMAGVAAGNQPQQPGKDPPELFIFMGTCFSILGLPYFGVIAYGARRMRNLSSYGWAMTAAIMAIASIVLFGVCGVLITGPGIWALVVIQKAHVRAAFEARGEDRHRPRGSRRPRDEYED